MKACKKDGIHRPFKNLKSMLEAKSFPLNSSPIEKVLLSRKVGFEDDDSLFRAAMADVTPLPACNKACFENQSTIDRYAEAYFGRNDDSRRDDEYAESQLKDLVECGKGFVVENTPEYMEGSGPDVCREVIRRLHRGQFSIQGFIDLHGFTVPAAKEAFEKFLKDAVLTGKRGVLIVHGRGLSSPSEPVLKTNVYNWLTKGPWRKWIIAFASARSCDGGAGATYVLLRQRPLTKRQRKLKLKGQPFAV